RRLIKQKARHHPASSTNSVIFEVTKHSRRSLLLLLFRISRSSWALTPCKHIISGTLSLRSQRFFSPFPRGTCSLSVANEYLGLRRGRLRFIRSFTCIVLLRKSLGVLWLSVTCISSFMPQLSRSLIYALHYHVMLLQLLSINHQLQPVQLSLYITS